MRVIDADELVRDIDELSKKDGCHIIDADIWMDDEDFCSHGERKEGAN